MSEQLRRRPPGLFTNIFLTEPRTYGVSLTKAF